MPEAKVVRIENSVDTLALTDARVMLMFDAGCVDLVTSSCDVLGQQISSVMKRIYVEWMS